MNERSEQRDGRFDQASLRLMSDVLLRSKRMGLRTPWDKDDMHGFDRPSTDYGDSRSGLEDI